MPEFRLPEGIDGHFADSFTEAAKTLAAQVSRQLEQRLARPGRASLAVCGGKTPVAFFQALRDQPLEWSRVDLLLTDERWVDVDDPASNSGMLYHWLLQGAASSARYLSLRQPGETVSASLPAVEAELACLSWPLDVVVLGMGNDGHTASLFPDAPQLDRALDPATTARVTVMTPPSQAQARITLTLAALDGAGYTALLLQGPAKLETLSRACSEPRAVTAMPVRAFLKPGLQVFWGP